MQRINVLWKLYFLDFIYSGIIRGFLPTLLGNIFYFARAIIVMAIFIFLFKNAKSFMKNGSTFLFICFLLTGYQSILLLFGEIDFKTFFYGLYLYVIPLVGLISTGALDTGQIIKAFRKILLISIPINLLVVLLQTVFKFTILYSAGFGAGLYSTEGVQRATGTFSSPAGFAIYMSVCLALMLSLEALNRKSIPQAHWIALLVMLGLSGSRTIVFNFAFVLLFLVIFGTRAKEVSSKLGRLFLLAVSSVGIVVLLPGTRNVLNAGINRFTEANRVDPPLTRIINQLWVKDWDWNPVGSGLGSRSLGSVVNVDIRVTISKWIEFDNARILAEAGSILFIAMLLVKILIILRGIQNRKIVGKRYRGIHLTLLLSCLPWIIFGQIFGQASIASGTFLIAYLLLGVSALREPEERKLES